MNIEYRAGSEYPCISFDAPTAGGPQNIELPGNGKLDAIEIHGKQTRSGTITFEGPIDAQSCDITAKTTTSGAITVNGDFKVKRFTISSRVTLSGKLTVKGNIDIEELVITDTGSLVVSGNLTCKAMNIHRITAEGPVQFSGIVRAPDGFTVDTLDTTSQFTRPTMASGSGRCFINEHSKG